MCNTPYITEEQIKMITKEEDKELEEKTLRPYINRDGNIVEIEKKVGKLKWW